MPDVRPIDANALYDQMTKGTKKYLVVEPGTKRIIEYGYHADDVLASIDQAPKLDYAPVRHGEWKLFGEKPITIRVDEWVVCSECNRDFMRITGIWFNYCPYCGAKMDGGQHD